MKRIVTLTLNPAIDAAAEAELVRPIRKIRTWGERYDPGGGGINVARVIQELGGRVLANRPHVREHPAPGSTWLSVESLSAGPASPVT